MRYFELSLINFTLLRKYQFLEKFEQTTTQPGCFVCTQNSLVEVCVSLTISIYRYLLLQKNENDFKLKVNETQPLRMANGEIVYTFR